MAAGTADGALTKMRATLDFDKDCLDIFAALAEAGDGSVEAKRCESLVSCRRAREDGEGSLIRWWACLGYERGCSGRCCVGCSEH